MFELLTVCSNIIIDGVSFGDLVMCQPYNGILSIGAAGCTGIKLRNLGTYDSPLDMGGTQQNDVAWTRVTTVATVTKTAHGLKVNDIVYVLYSDNTAGIPVGTKTVATVPTADTFTFTCTNSGTASGVLTYYPTMAANLFVIATAGAANNVSIQKCYTPHTRTSLFTGDNSNKNITIANVFGDYVNAPTVPLLNCYIKGMGSTTTLTAQTSVYGTHWFSDYNASTTPNTSSVAWSRATTTATVTSAGHNLRTGRLINVTVTSDVAAIVLGQKTITVINSSTFTFTCLNAGAASGTITFVPLVDRVGLLMNESTSDTSGQYTIDAGGAAFTSAGGLYMPTVNDQITFTTPYYILGPTSFPIAEAVMAGGTIGNYDITYAIDENDGNGFSSFKNLYYPRAGGGGSNASTTVTMTSTTGVASGDYVWGTNIAPNAKVVTVDSSTNITVDKANIGAVSGILRFNQLPSETLFDASLGYKFKIRIKTTTTNATAITSLYHFITSTSTSRAYTYPLDIVTLTVTVLDALGNPIQNARVGIYQTSNNVELLNALTDINGIATGTTPYTTDTNIYVRVRKTSKFIEDLIGIKTAS
jgi:hypothetical protein